jgi:hypothetical protein
VANNIRNGKLGVDVELMSVSWYAHIPKDIDSMYAFVATVNNTKSYCKLQVISAKGGMQ